MCASGPRSLLGGVALCSQSCCRGSGSPGVGLADRSRSLAAAPLSQEGRRRGVRWLIAYAARRRYVWTPLCGLVPQARARPVSGLVASPLLCLDARSPGCGARTPLLGCARPPRLGSSLPFGFRPSASPAFLSGPDPRRRPFWGRRRGLGPAMNLCLRAPPRYTARDGVLYGLSFSRARVDVPCCLIAAPPCRPVRSTDSCARPLARVSGGSLSAVLPVTTSPLIR